jgi:hypothetical protein
MSAMQKSALERRLKSSQHHILIKQPNSFRQVSQGASRLDQHNGHGLGMDYAENAKALSGIR